MKQSTTIEQSRQLSEILPIETADMCLFPNNELALDYRRQKEITDELNERRKRDGYKYYIEVFPAWSLSALLNYLSHQYYVRLVHDGIAWCTRVTEHDKEHLWQSSESFDDPIDACVEMIVKLNEQKLI